VYDPTIGRWLTEDPTELDGRDYNFTRYVGNSPTNATDPSGLLEEPGHHFLPAAVVKRFLDRLTDEALWVAAGFRTGPIADHKYDKAHREFSRLAERELDRFIRENVGKEGKLTGDQMMEFINRLIEGKSYFGAGDKLKEYSKKCSDLAKNPASRDKASIVEYGRTYLKQNLDRYVAVAAIMSVLALFDKGKVMAGQVGDISTAPEVREAITAAMRGDLGRVQKILIGNGPEEAFLDTNLFGRIAKQMQSDNASTAKIAAAHYELMEFFASLSRFKGRIGAACADAPQARPRAQAARQLTQAEFEQLSRACPEAAGFLGMIWVIQRFLDEPWGPRSTPPP
jgi:hypothetical protein